MLVGYTHVYLATLRIRINAEINVIEIIHTRINWLLPSFHTMS